PAERMPALCKSLRDYTPIDHWLAQAALDVRVDESSKAHAQLLTSNSIRWVSGKAAYDAWAAQTALRRLAQPGELADAVVFLASERAAYTSGQSLLVDGGFYKGSA
ncbi:MAG: SDR family oxidoreductase, partial [Terriglobales bacterium]